MLNSTVEGKGFELKNGEIELNWPLSLLFQRNGINNRFCVKYKKKR